MACGEKLYERPLEISDLHLEACPEANESSVPIGGHTNGCRIGFDAGGSDRKVSAVVDGECVYSEEVVWFPKLNPDPDYQFQGILDSFRTAASKMPRVDAIRLVNEKKVQLEPLITKVFPFEQFQDAYVYIDENREKAMKIIVNAQA